MPIIYAVVGPTGAGKTEVANYLEQIFSVKHIHPARHMKEHYEELLDMPEGWLDTQEGKAFKPDGCDFTMQEVMMSEYHHKQKYFPIYSACNLNKTLPKHLNRGEDVCVVSIRNLSEPPVLINIAERDQHLLVLIRLTRPGYEGISTDEHLKAITSLLDEHAQLSFVVDNNEGVRELQNKIHAIASMAMQLDYMLTRPAEERVASY